MSFETARDSDGVVSEENAFIRWWASQPKQPDSLPHKELLVDAQLQEVPGVGYTELPIAKTTVRGSRMCRLAICLNVLYLKERQTPMVDHRGKPYPAGKATGMVTRALGTVECYGGEDAAADLVRSWNEQQRITRENPELPNYDSEDPPQPVEDEGKVNGVEPETEPPAEEAEEAEVAEPAPVGLPNESR